jgi:alpha-galactosidase
MSLCCRIARRSFRMTLNAKSCLPVFLLFLLSSVPISAQSSLTGYWVWRVPMGDGNFRETYLHLQQMNKTVTGTVIFGSRELPIADGTINDGNLHFVVTLHYRNEAHHVQYNGKIEGGRIELTETFLNRPARHGFADRTTREATLPPPRLPLPALHDVRDNGLARTPPMRWNSWNKFAGRINDQTVREIADAMVSSGMKRVGYTYVNIDDTWEGPRDANGRITTNRKFPNMKALADYVHSKGLKIGIYSSPGLKTCAGYEGSYGHELQDAETYAAWGIDYLKYDWCSAGRIYKPDEMRAVYQKMGDALLKTGRPIVFGLCQYGEANVWTWGAKVGGNSWRTTGDINDRWKSMEAIGFSQLGIAPYIRPGHWNDPDMLEIGNDGMTDEEYRTHMSLWSMLAAPLLAGNDLRRMSEATKDILMNTEVIAIDQDPAAKPAKLVKKNGMTEVWERPLHDGSLAVALFNRGDQPAEVSVSWAAAGLAGRKLSVRDLWKHQAVEPGREAYAATVPVHGVVLLRATPNR